MRRDRQQHHRRASLHSPGDARSRAPLWIACHRDGRRHCFTLQLCPPAFQRGEIGLYKGIVLVNRINLFWGVNWKAIPRALTAQTLAASYTAYGEPTLRPDRPPGRWFTQRSRIFWISFRERTRKKSMKRSATWFTSTSTRRIWGRERAFMWRIEDGIVSLVLVR